MIHYHGGPITPETCAYKAWNGGHAFISFARPDQIRIASAICQTFALDNGAFSFWKRGGSVDWQEYYDWCAEWLSHPACDWAVIPDVIGGTEEENDALIAEWPFLRTHGVPVWHLNESPERLVRLAATWPRVALGSCDEWDVSEPARSPGRPGSGRAARSAARAPGTAAAASARARRRPARRPVRGRAARVPVRCAAAVQVTTDDGPGLQRLRMLGGNAGTLR